MNSKILPLAPAIAALLSIGAYQPAHAADMKHYSAGGCAPYTTGTPNYNELRFRSDGVQNQSNGYRYVICPIVRDSEDTWGITDGADVTVHFRTNTTGNFQCTLTGGATVGGSHAITQSISGDPGQNIDIVFANVNFAAEGVTDAPVSLVCRLPPKGTLSLYHVNERPVTDDPHVP